LTDDVTPPAVPPATASVPPPELSGVPPVDPAEVPVGESEVRPEQLSLVARLRQPRTIISLVLPILLLALFAKSLPGFKLEELPAKILGANPWLLIGAFVIFYAGFPLRGLRWAMLVHRSGFPLTVRDSTEIIFLSWLVNCLVPAKLGDVYRAYLLKINSPVSLSRTFGTVFIERILDLFAIVVLGLAAGFVSFRSGLPSDVQIVFLIGVVFVLVLAGGLLTMRNFGRRIITRLPLPHRVLEFYDRFEEGVFASIGMSALPRLVIVTGLIWGTEAMRLYFVVQALGLPGVHLGISGAFFVALSASLLTAVPLTPAGIGFVETGVVGLLTLVYAVSNTDALAITLVDRAISVLSIIILGSIAYAISPKRRGMGVSMAEPPSAAAPA
jgi:glycosyltransferase 2 family protein